MSTFWSLWISVITAIVLIGCTWLLLANRKVEVSGEEATSDEVPTTGHIYDGIQEYDNPLPRWWFITFLGSVIFAVAYLVWFPGLGSFKGLGDWSSAGQWQQEVDEAEEAYGELYAQYAATPVEELVNNPEAVKMGGRLYASNCSVCHGSTAQGSYGFPNLTDNKWLYGGTPDAIKASITHGRQGIMPAWGEVIGEEGVVNVSEYVLQLSGLEHDAEQAKAGAQVFATTCTTCHGPEGKGMQALGAPNLTDNNWLYNAPGLSLRSNIRHSVRNGRNGVMPAHADMLQADKIHLLTTYVYSLTHQE